MLFLRILVFLALSATPALALSCLPYFPEQAFLDAEASPDRYVVVHGHLDFNPDDMPRVDYGGHPWPDNLLGATLSGFSLTGSGFDARFVRKVQVNLRCAGVWCGQLQPGQMVLAFLKKENGGYLLEQLPCGGMAFPEPTEAVLERMHQCLLGEECTPPPLSR